MDRNFLHYQGKFGPFTEVFCHEKLNSFHWIHHKNGSLQKDMPQISNRINLEDQQLIQCSQMNSTCVSLNKKGAQ